MREYITLPDNSDKRRLRHHVMSGISRLEMFDERGHRRTSLWLYKYFWNGKKKSERAWSRWDMCGEVLSAAILNTGVYLIMPAMGSIWKRWTSRRGG